MAGITLGQAEARLDAYMTAEEKVLNNQSYSIEGRSMTRADLSEIREGIKYWNDLVAQLGAGSGRRIRYVTTVTD